MKKISAIVFTFLLCLCLLVGCGSVSNDSASTGESYDYSDVSQAEGSYTSSADTDNSLATSAMEYGRSNDNEKIIYTASSDIETTDFDATIAGIKQNISQYGAYLEQSYISGSSYSDSYFGYTSYRSSDLTVRVPCDDFDDFLGSLSEFGNVLYTEISTDTVTGEYYDIQSRLEAYQAEHDRLVEIMQQADNVSDMIVIEERLSEVEYQIDSYTSSKNTLDNKIDYSTVYLHINEVENLTEKEQAHQTYWQKLGSGFVGTLKGIGVFFKELFRLFITALPVLIILAVVALIILIIIHRRLRVRRKQVNSQTKNEQSSGNDSENLQ